jgi:hypothetical protein
VKYWPPFALTFQKGQNGITKVFAFGLPFMVYKVELWTMENNVKGPTIVDKFGKQHWELDGNQLKAIWNTLNIKNLKFKIFSKPTFGKERNWSYLGACWFTSLIHGSVFFWCMEFLF